MVRILSQVDSQAGYGLSRAARSVLRVDGRPTPGTMVAAAAGWFWEKWRLLALTPD